MKQAGKYIGLQAEIQKKNIPEPCFLSTTRLPARQGKSFGKRFYNGPEHVHNTESLRPEQCAGTDALLPVSGKPCRRSPGSSAQGWTSAAAATGSPADPAKAVSLPKTAMRRKGKSATLHLSPSGAPPGNIGPAPASHRPAAIETMAPEPRQPKAYSISAGSGPKTTRVYTILPKYFLTTLRIKSGVMLSARPD